jgi:hypothetical protein
MWGPIEGFALLAPRSVPIGNRDEDAAGGSKAASGGGRDCDWITDMLKGVETRNNIEGRNFAFRELGETENESLSPTLGESLDRLGVVVNPYSTPSTGSKRGEEQPFTASEIGDIVPIRDAPPHFVEIPPLRIVWDLGHQL